MKLLASRNMVKILWLFMNLNICCCFSMFGLFKKKKEPGCVYGIKVRLMDGVEDFPLEKYKGTPLIIVNVASKCGFAAGAYEKLKEIAEKYDEDQIKILLFPCRQFANQEYKEKSEIRQFAERHSKKFILMDPVFVKGSEIHPLFAFLVSEEKGAGTLYNGIKWNFTTFLIDKEGMVAARWGSGKTPGSDDNTLIKVINS